MAENAFDHRVRTPVVSLVVGLVLLDLSLLSVVGLTYLWSGPDTYFRYQSLTKLAVDYSWAGRYVLGLYCAASYPTGKPAAAIAIYALLAIHVFRILRVAKSPSRPVPHTQIGIVSLLNLLALFLLFRPGLLDEHLCRAGASICGMDLGLLLIFVGVFSFLIWLAGALVVWLWHLVREVGSTRR